MADRTEIIENEKLEKLLVEKSEFLLEGRALSKQIDELTKQRDDFGQKLQKLKNKIIPLVVKCVKTEEFEELGTVDINKNGKIEVTVFDMIDSFKKQVRESRKQNTADKPG